MEPCRRLAGMGLHSLQLPWKVLGVPNLPRVPNLLALAACLQLMVRLAGRDVDVSRHLFCSRGCVYFRSIEYLSFCNRNALRFGVPGGLPKNWANCKLKGNGVAKNQSVCEGQT